MSELERIFQKLVNGTKLEELVVLTFTKAAASEMKERIELKIKDNLKNKFGDDLVINGKKVPIPSIDYKFLLKENNQVSLQQINLEDDQRVYYDGKIKVIENKDDILKLECSLNDGKNSNPTYILLMNRVDKSVVCSSQNQPEFPLKKIK